MVVMMCLCFSHDCCDCFCWCSKPNAQLIQTDSSRWTSGARTTVVASRVWAIRYQLLCVYGGSSERLPQLSKSTLPACG